MVKYFDLIVILESRKLLSNGTIIIILIIDSLIGHQNIKIVVLIIVVNVQA